MMRLVTILGLSALSTAALAQSAAPKANGPLSALPDKGIVASPAPSVIRPGNPDPGMAVKPPAAGITPVVPPPGTNGSNQTVIPK